MPTREQVEKEEALRKKELQDASPVNTEPTAAPEAVEDTPEAVEVGPLDAEGTPTEEPELAEAPEETKTLAEKVGDDGQQQ